MNLNSLGCSKTLLKSMLVGLLEDVVKVDADAVGVRDGQRARWGAAGRRREELAQP